MNNIKIGIDCLILRENGSGISDIFMKLPTLWLNINVLLLFIIKIEKA